MPAVLNSITSDWKTLGIPFIVLAVSLIATFWVRRWALQALSNRLKTARGIFAKAAMSSIAGPFTVLCLVFSSYLALAVSSAPNEWKIRVGNALWTLFILSLDLGLFSASRVVVSHYAQQYRFNRQTSLVVLNVARITIIVISAFIIMELWGVPITALLLLIAVLVLLVLLGFRDVVPNLFASFQLAANQEIKVGDYIKLDAGEEGYVVEMSWNKTRLRSPGDNFVLIPNSQLVNRRLVNYGRPLKKAKDPFLFNARTHLAELTGLKACNLSELLSTLKTAPDPMVYFHTHHFIEERQYLVPQLSNDFATWVGEALGNARLAERLASVDPFEFGALCELRDRFVGLLQEYLQANPEQRSALPGRELHFIQSVSVIMPTTYQARDLREFVEALRKISSSSLYYHVFESRLRLGQTLNDFSLWLEKSMEEPELSKEIAGIDPYTYTLEGLRSLLIQVIEKHIK
jgi:small-conductance mechanosensitive channel